MNRMHRIKRALGIFTRFLATIEYGAYGALFIVVAGSKKLDFFPLHSAAKLNVFIGLTTVCVFGLLLFSSLHTRRKRYLPDQSISTMIVFDEDGQECRRISRNVFWNLQTKFVALVISARVAAMLCGGMFIFGLLCLIHISVGAAGIASGPVSRVAGFAIMFMGAIGVLISAVIPLVIKPIGASAARVVCCADVINSGDADHIKASNDCVDDHDAAGDLYNLEESVRAAPVSATLNAVPYSIGRFITWAFIDANHGKSSSSVSK